MKGDVIKSIYGLCLKEKWAFAMLFFSQNERESRNLLPVKILCLHNRLELQHISAKFEGLLLCGKDNVHGELRSYLLVSGSFDAIIYHRLHACCYYALFLPSFMQSD